MKRIDIEIAVEGYEIEHHEKATLVMLHPDDHAQLNPFAIASDVEWVSGVRVIPVPDVAEGEIEVHRV